MTESSSARPPQVTMAGWVTMVGSVFVLFSLFETVAGLRSLESRERVESMLSEPPLEGTGLTFEGWISFVHVVSMVGAAAAVAAGILGFYVLRQHKVARVVLTALGVPLFFAGFVTSNLLMMLVAVSVTMLWSRPSRDWFAGRPWVPQTIPSRADRTARRDGSDVEDPSSAQPPTPPPAPWEQPPSEGDRRPAPHEGQPQPWQHPAQDRPMPATGDARAHAGFGAVGRPVVPTGRPTALVTACVLTWVCAGIVAFGCLLAVLGLGLAPEVVHEEYLRQDVSDETGVGWDEARRVALGASAVFGVWSLVALVLAAFAFAGREWARLTLVVSAGSAATLLLLSAFSGGAFGLVLVLPTIACVTAAVMLLRPEVRGWVRARSVR